MIRSAAGKVMWVGRATVFLVGLAVILALVFGAATTAFGANGNPFLLGKKNAATLLTKLTGNVNGAAMQVANSNAGADDTALNLSVQAGEAPMKVNSSARVANLNAARAGRADSAASADAATNAQNAANADQLDGKSSEQFANGVGGKATDADKLDGKDSAAFVLSDAVYNKNSGGLMSGQANGYVEHSLSCNPGDKLLSGSYSMWVSGSSPGSITNAKTGFLVGRAEVRADSPERYLLGWHSDATPVNADLTVVCLDRG